MKLAYLKHLNKAPCSRREEGHRGCFHNTEDIELKFILQLLF